LGNDIKETKQGLIKEMEVCEQKEEIIKTRIFEEQKKKLLSAM